MARPATRTIERRAVAWDPATSVLTVGRCSTVVTCVDGDNECVLRTYLALVARQRDIPVDRGLHLRRDDVAVLAELLDLDDADLDARLARLLRLSTSEAADLHRRLRQAAAAVGIGLLAALPMAAHAGASELPGTVALGGGGADKALHAVPAAVVVDDTPPPAPAPTPAAVTVEVEVGPAVVHEQPPPPPAPDPDGPDTDIGDALTIER